MAEKYQLNFLLTEGEHGWCARCLEHDFVTQADTLQQLLHEIQRTILGYAIIARQLGKAPFEDLPRAAEQYQEMFRQSIVNVAVRRRATAEMAIAFEADHAGNLPTPEVQELRVAELV